jgi:hypothetical protein
VTKPALSTSGKGKKQQTKMTAAPMLFGAAVFVIQKAEEHPLLFRFALSAAYGS